MGTLMKTASSWEAKTASHRHGPNVKRVVTRGRPQSAGKQVAKKMSALDRAKYSGHGGY